MIPTFDTSQVFEFQPKQLDLCLVKAPERLAVGGVRSGKTTGALMFGVFRYVLRFERCDILCLRRTFPELEAGLITDLKTFAAWDGKPQFDWNDTKHVATFENGSRVQMGSCTNNKEKDIEKYLGQAYPFILVDECAQFSPDAWELLKARNTVNAGCKPLADSSFPQSVLWGCTNPIGPFWLHYKSIFVDRKPSPMPEGAKRDDNGKWWVEEAGERRCVYDPANFAVCHSTVLDNPAILKRDPGIVARLNSLSPAKREKFLFGLLDRVEGQYFDSFNPEYHVLNLREDIEAIIWQPHQAVWAGWDWGMAHHNAIYFFTRALVRKPGGDYKLKTVCFAEVVTTGKSQSEMISLLTRACKLPNGLPVKLSAIYFSHEKFNRQMERHSPADELSRLLRDTGQCMVSPATRDRIASASFVYNELQTGQLVILDNCVEIIQSLPTLQRNPDHLDDVLKVDNKADDCYDGFRYGLFGQLGDRTKSRVQREQERIAEIKDPFVRHFEQFKVTMNAQRRRDSPISGWATRIRAPE